MSRTRFPLFPLAMLVVIGLLILGGFAIHRISWLEGYRTGQLADAGTVAPYAPYRPGCGGVLLAFGAIFLLFLVAAKFFRFWMWKSAWDPESERRVRHWHRRGLHSPAPPWWWEGEWPPDSEAEQPKADADADAGDAKA